jgi:hypothetical protein
MPPVSKKQAKWAFQGCPGSNMSKAKCAEFTPHGVGAMSALPEVAASSKKSRPTRSKRA